MKHPLDSRQLLAFLTVVRRQSFTLAAHELHLTQSAISHSMRALETDLGCRLLDRSGRRIQLTEQGSVFLERAERILAEMEQARQELGSLEHATGIVSAA
ncbi:MAG TPA: LysR family transcriptional regulator [Opitutaceae bacterium]|nr:LysR family transcriptional regulator [Opitutaceae bacterium]